METGLQLGSDLLQVGSHMIDLTWSNKDPSNKAVSIFETVIINFLFSVNKFFIIKYLNSSEIRVFTTFHKILYLAICNLCALANNLIYLISSLLILSFQEQSILLLGERLSLLLKLLLETILKTHLFTCLPCWFPWWSHDNNFG